MCKFNPKNDGRRIDPCMGEIVKFINDFTNFETLACCCGHKKYPMTLIVRSNVVKNTQKLFCGLEIFSGKYIERTRKFYKKDKQGYYYIPETLK